MRQERFDKILRVVLGRMQYMLETESGVVDKTYVSFGGKDCMGAACIIVQTGSDLSNSLRYRIANDEVERLFEMYAYRSSEKIAFYAYIVINGKKQLVQDFNLDDGDPVKLVDTAEAMHRWIYLGTTPLPLSAAGLLN